MTQQSVEAAAEPSLVTSAAIIAFKSLSKTKKDDKLARCFENRDRVPDDVNLDMLEKIVETDVFEAGITAPGTQDLLKTTVRL